MSRHDWKQQKAPAGVRGFLSRFIWGSKKDSDSSQETPEDPEQQLPMDETLPDSDDDSFSSSSPSPESSAQPLIGWSPDYDLFCDRVARLAVDGRHRPKSLPKGFAAKVETSRAWSGQDFQQMPIYIELLSQDEIAEINRALTHMEGETF